jgi:hypothetical protein
VELERRVCGPIVDDKDIFWFDVTVDDHLTIVAFWPEMVLDKGNCLCDLDEEAPNVCFGDSLEVLLVEVELLPVVEVAKRKVVEERSAVAVVWEVVSIP